MKKFGRVLFNIFWIIWIGLYSAAYSAIFGACCCVTIIGIPFGLQYFKYIKLVFAPAGRKVVLNFTKHPILNTFWVIFGGLESFLIYCLLGLVCFITIIGIPLGKQLFKIAIFNIAPFGAEIVLENHYTNKKNTLYDYNLLFRHIKTDFSSSKDYFASYLEQANTKTSALSLANLPNKESILEVLAQKGLVVKNDNKYFDKCGKLIDNVITFNDKGEYELCLNIVKEYAGNNKIQTITHDESLSNLGFRINSDNKVVDKFGMNFSDTFNNGGIDGAKIYYEQTKQSDMVDILDIGRNINDNSISEKGKNALGVNNFFEFMTKYSFVSKKESELSKKELLIGLIPFFICFIPFFAIIGYNTYLIASGGTPNIGMIIIGCCLPFVFMAVLGSLKYHYVDKVILKIYTDNFGHLFDKYPNDYPLAKKNKGVYSMSYLSTFFGDLTIEAMSALMNQPTNTPPNFNM